MKVHRITAGLAALLVIFTLLSGCALIEQDKEEEIPKKQLYVYYPHDNSHIMKSLIMQYNHMQQEVIVEGIEGSGLRTEFLEKLTEMAHRTRNPNSIYSKISIVHPPILRREARSAPADAHRSPLPVWKSGGKTQGMPATGTR